MSKYDYEVVEYVIKWDETKETVRDTEESAIEFARSVENANPCIYKIEKMIMEDIKA